MSFLKFTGVAAGLCGLAAGAAHADPASFVGKWHWNKAESSAVAGEPAPQDILLNITSLAGGKLQWTLTEIDPRGGKHVESFDGDSNGTAAPVTGAGAPTTAAFTLSGDSLSAAFKSQDGTSDNWTCGLAPNAAKMMCKGAESDGKGHNENYTDVYDRS